MSAVLVCPSCGAEHGEDARFCSGCGMPLVHAGAAEARVNERQERARKIKPQYAQGALVRVAWARNQSEAELIEGMLLEEGIPSVMRRPPGFDVPDFMAAASSAAVDLAFTRPEGSPARALERAFSGRSLIHSQGVWRAHLARLAMP